MRQHEEEELGFSELATFNPDEVLGLLPSHPRSYRHVMNEHLFGHISGDTDAGSTLKRADY